MNWTIQKWKDVLSIVNGKNQKEVVSDDGAYPIIGSGGEIGRATNFLCEAGSTVVGRKGTINNPFFVEERFWNVDTAFGIQPGEKLNPKFLFYFCKCFNFKNLDKSTTIPSLAKTDLLNIEMPVPSLKEQRQIVNKIEELFSELDSAVETLKKTKEQLAVYRQSVLKEAFEACLQSETLKDVCSCITDGDHMPPPKASSGIPFVMISDVKNNTIQWDDTAFVKRDYFEKLDKKRVPQKGDVLYTVTGSFGIPIIVDYEKEFCFQRHIALLRPDLTKIEQKYLFYVMQSPQIFQQASDVATGTAQKTVGLTVLRTINIPYDNIQQQRKIVNHIESRLSACENIEKTVNEALMQADAMRQSILKKAFEGSL